MSLLDTCLTAMDKYFDEHPYGKLDEARARCRGIVRAYVDLYEAKDREAYKVIEAESLLLAPVKNPHTGKPFLDYHLGGKIDVRVSQTRNGKRSIIDHKVLSTLIGDFEREHLLIDTQPMQYALLEWMNDVRVDSCIWDCISKTQHRLTQKESPQNFEDRIYEMYSKDPEAYFARCEFPVSQARLADYAQELFSWVQMMHSARMTGQHLRTPESCKQYNRPCRYHEICSGRMDMLRGLEQGKLVKLDNVHAELDLPAGVEARNVITNSRLKIFRTCMAKHDYQYNLGIRKASESPEEPLYLGSAVHIALEHFWKHLGDATTT